MTRAEKRGENATWRELPSDVPKPPVGVVFDPPSVLQNT